MKERSNDDPLVTIGQGDYARHIRPSHFDKGLFWFNNREECIGLFLVVLFYFFMGFVLGAGLW